VIIERLPSFLQRFFSPMRPRLSGPQFAHLWSLVLAVVVNLRAAKLVHLSAATPRQGHRTSAGAFLSRSDWDAPALVERAAADLLASMKPRAGEVVYLILDDTRIPKRGRKMGYVSKIWDHKQQRFVRGHVALFAAVAFRGVVLPWKVELWKPKGHPCPRYRKLTDMAAAMVKAFVAPAGVKVRVLFDAFYLCPTVTKACEGNGFTFFSVAARNRTFTTDHGRRRGIAALMPEERESAAAPRRLLRHKGRRVRMRRSRGHATLRIASADGHLSRIGRVRMGGEQAATGAVEEVRRRRGDRRDGAETPAGRGDLRDALADRGAVQGAAPGLGAGGLPDAGRGRDRPPPARLLPCPPAADPPERGGSRCTSKQAERASHAAAHEHAPRRPARGDRPGPHRATCAGRAACETTTENV
jgi:hypothetical protein